MEVIKTARFLEKFFRKKPENTIFAPSLNGFIPWYSQFGTDVYKAVSVQQAIKCIADEMKKLNPVHVRYVNNDPQPIKGTIQDVLDNPNDLMTTAEFIEKIVWILMLNYNAFVIPVYSTWIDEKTGAEKRYYEALYPILPQSVDFIEDESNTLYVNFWFRNGSQTTIPYDDVIHIKENFSVSEYMGGNLLGQPDHEPLLESLKVYHDLTQGVAKAMNASFSINGVVRYNSLIDKQKNEQAVKEFMQQLQNNQDGFIVADQKFDFIPMKREGKIIDTDMVKFFDEQVLRNFGVPLSILTGDYNAVQYRAFYQKTLESKIKVISQAFTKKLLTKRERAFGNRIDFLPQELVFLSIQQTIEAINLLAPTGAMTENEKRVALGLHPDTALEGKRYMSLNWIETKNADQYQAKNVNVDIVDEEKQNDMV